MSADRFRVDHDPQEEKSHTAPGDSRGDYDFHAFCLNTMDVVWAWALVVAVLLLPTLIL